MSACAICGDYYPDFVLYDMHMKLSHHSSDVRIIEHAVAVVHPKKREWVPMDRAEKARIVAQGEKRIGLQHFLGGK